MPNFAEDIGLGWIERLSEPLSSKLQVGCSKPDASVFCIFHDVTLKWDQRTIAYDRPIRLRLDWTVTMPYDVTFKDKRIVKRFFGFVSAKEFESSASRTSASSAFDECRYVIIDFTDIDGHDLTVESFEFASAQQVVAKSANRMVHVAIVTGDADIAKFALTAIDAQGTSGFPTRVFSSVDDALTWFSRLGRNPP